MKIATYNLEFLFDEGVQKHLGKECTFSKEFIDARVLHFADEFKKLNADFLFLQELGSENVLQRIIKRMNGNYNYFIATPDRNGVGNAVIYKSDNCECESVPTKTNLPVFVEGDKDVMGSRMWSRREFVKLKTEYQNKSLYMLGIHIQSSWLIPEKNNTDSSSNPMNTQIDKADGLIRTEIFRFNQARKVRQIVDEFFSGDNNADIIVAGDFNSLETDKPFQVIQGPEKEAYDSLVSVTLKIPKERRYTIDSAYSNKALIDHILISKHLQEQVSSVDIFNEDIYDHVSDPNNPYIVPSDHAPILIELK